LPLPFRSAPAAPS